MSDKRRNCWEAMKCGREPGGEKSEEFGVCPAAVTTEFDGLNKGQNGGRFCWAVEDTPGNGNAKGSHRDKFMECIDCEFMQEVFDEEGDSFILFPEKAEEEGWWR